jgi:hypothetical protein
MPTSGDAAMIPRLAPELPLPPYAFVPGLNPHPQSDPRGHSYGVKPTRPAAPDPVRWQECRPYVHSIDLFNHGYYWEAHEVWESLWHVCGRSGMMADFLKGLIQLAAAGVKVREGRPMGVLKHARRAAELFEQVAHQRRDAEGHFLGLAPVELADFARAVVGDPPRTAEAVSGPVCIVFDRTLCPRD